MKFSEVKDLSSVELVKRINEKKNEMFQLKMKHSLGQLANPMSVRTGRKELAVMMTALGQKKAEAVVASKES